MPSKNNKRSSLINILTLAVLSISIFCTYIYKPLPDDFQQPWKYRLICFGSDFITAYGKILEAFDLGHRLNVTRFFYHWTIGAFNIRDRNDQILVYDDIADNIPIRIYRPENRANQTMPTILYYHGGGHFLGSADVYEPITYILSRDTNYQVIYVEFRLIPENKYPATLVDALTATKHLISNNLKYSIDLNNLVICGDSAGGNLATVISQTLIQDKTAVPKLQVLIYPILQFFDFTLPSYRINLPKSVLGNIDFENFKNFIHYMTQIEVDDSIFHNGHTNRHQKESILSEYVNHGYLPAKLRHNDLEELAIKNDTSNKYSKLSSILLDRHLSPLLVDDGYLLKNTPVNTILVTCELDILRDDGFIYAARLRKLGLNVEHKHYENLFHGILSLIFGPLEFYEAHKVMADITHAIKSV